MYIITCICNNQQGIPSCIFNLSFTRIYIIDICLMHSDEISIILSVYFHYITYCSCRVTFFSSYVLNVLLNYVNSSDFLDCLKYILIRTIGLITY